MNYSDLVNFVGRTFIIGISSTSSYAPFTDQDANDVWAQSIDAAERKIYADLDFLQTYRTSKTSSTTAGSREMTLPTGTIVVEGISVDIPETSGTRTTPLTLTTVDFIDMLCQFQSARDKPIYAAMKDAQTVVLGPTPDGNYTSYVYGTYRPDPISYTNTTTWLSTTYPELLQASIALWWCAYQRDFGAQSSDPQMAMSWQATYDKLKTQIADENRRSKGQRAVNPNTKSDGD